MINEEDKYSDLIIKFLLGEIQPEEEKLLLSWKNVSKENEAFFHEVRDTWFVTSQVKQFTSFNEFVALENLHQKIEKQNSAVLNVNKYQLVLKQFARIAAIFIVVFAFGGFAGYYYLTKIVNPDSKIVKVFAPKGSKSVTILPDGTTVWLNAGSEITYNLNSDISRNLTLVGEAFFRVKSDPKHPFIVTANGIKIKALGTSFNVKAYPEEKKVITTLVEGIVKIENRKKGQDEPFVITMKPNQKVIIYNDSSLYFMDKEKLNTAITSKEKTVLLEDQKLMPAIKAIDVNTKLYTSWKDDRWIIEGEEVGNLATLLERKYNVNILFQTDELKKYRFSGTFTNETIEQALSLMRYTLPFDYKIDKNTIILKVDPVLKKSYKQAYEKIE